MEQMSPQQLEAFRLIREEIDIPGTVAKIAELEKQAPDDEQELWGYVWEAFMAAASEEAILEMHELPE